MASLGTHPVWFITGCSTGFGREMAKIILEAGGKCVVTARDETRVHDLIEGHGDRARAYALDVNDPAQVRHVTADAEKAMGAIDVLVNNAGYGYMAAVEEGEDDEVRAMFETNVFGLIDMTKAVLPGMRARRRGHVVNVSSMGGLAGFPGVGYYNATKFAVEGLSEALAAELTPLGLGVTIVEPGPFRTDWAGRSLKMTKTDIDAYSESAGARRRNISAYTGQQPGDPVRASQAIIDAVQSGKPPLRMLLGKVAMDVVGKKLDTMRDEFKAWEGVSLATDYPVKQAAE